MEAAPSPSKKSRVSGIPTLACAPEKCTLVYWDIRGLAQACRYALVYAGVDFDDVRIDPGDPEAADYKQSWFAHKQDVGITFANLPYLIDEDVAIPQSNAILRHVCRKHGLIAETLQASAQNDAILDQLCDFDSVMTRMCYGNFAAKDDWVACTMKPNLEKFNAVLAKGGKSWFGGDTIGSADFKAYEEFDKCKIIAPEACADWPATLPALNSFMERFAAIPKIAEYLSSPRFKARPLNNKHAQFK